MIEQRKHIRFLLEQAAFASLGSEYNRIGKIIDMSMGGLSFEYIVGEKIKLNTTKLDIFFIGNVFHLYNIPCKIIYDIKIHVPHVNSSFIKILTKNRCGLKFNKLSKDEFLQLKLFIENNSGIFSGQ